MVVVGCTHEAPVSRLVQREDDRRRFDADVTEAAFVGR